MIKILNENKTSSGWVFEVQVTNNRSETNHEVSLKEKYWSELTREGISPEDLIKKSFQFLLERELKEAILREFDIEIIEKYFPEYEKEVLK